MYLYFYLHPDNIECYINLKKNHLATVRRLSNVFKKYSE